MPTLRFWWPSPKNIEWEETTRSLIDMESGPSYMAYPLWWLVPYTFPEEKDLAPTGKPMWIPDIHPTSPYGVTLPGTEPSYVLDLPATFGSYIEGLPYRHRKSLRNILKRNSDLVIRKGTEEDFEALWPLYVDRINHLNHQDGWDPYTKKELSARKDFYGSQRMEYLAFELNGELIALNISLTSDGIVYDLACLSKPDDELKRRSLGVMAILSNIDWAISRNFGCYDMLTGSPHYKEQFGPRVVPLKHFVQASRAFVAAYNLPEEFVTIIG